ncbi:RNA polymerase sigma factor [Desulfobacula phenolica]|uniref:RNA polymerase sigma-70 factor, ECF subfamily n=1 Tax=Desulfobacula phenolica TaxID=90732 RepID=A0A1H2GNT8_9BACT|nr:RNA polymerase sigma factor [Desulfobacula phenolica]SDU21373.1 RNA polymerase sigma-70 factor, ECF subfamily [Desulfobacula phenolica]
MNNMIKKDQDAELITAAGKGDQKAFERLVQKHGAALFNFLLRYLGDRTTAEDIVQEVFIRIYTSVHKFKKMTGVKASSWIFKIAYNLSINEIKRRKRYKHFYDALNQNAQNTRQPDQIKEWETRKDIMAGLKRLPEDQRAALILRVNEGYSYREISDILNLSISSVESLIFRARKGLKKHLKF